MTHVTGGDLALLQTVSRGQSTRGVSSQPFSIHWMSLSDTLRCARLFLHYIIVSRNGTTVQLLLMNLYNISTTLCLIEQPSTVINELISDLIQLPYICSHRDGNMYTE